MAANHYSPGHVLDHVAAAAITSGDVVVIGTVVGVALGTVAIGATVSVRVSGAYTLPKLNTDVFAQGALVYWDDTANRLTTTSAGNTLAGYATVAKAASTTTGVVTLNGNPG